MGVILTESEKHILETCMGEITKLATKIETEATKAIEERSPELAERLSKELDDKIAGLRTFVSSMPNTSIPGVELEAEKKPGFSFARVATAQIENDWSNAGYELEVKKALQEKGVYEKAQSLGTASAGGYIVPEQAAEEVIDRLRADAVVFQLGARSIDGLDRSPVIFPRLSASTTAAWGTEAAAISASDATFDEVSLAIKELRTLNVYSNMLLRTSHPSIEQVIRDDMAKQFALAIDSAALQGPGTGGAPTGIANTSGVNTQAVGATITYDTLVGFLSELRNDDALTGSLGWAMAPESFNAIMTMKDSTEEVTLTGPAYGVGHTQPLMRRVLWDGPQDTLLGYPYRTSSQLPATVGAADSIIFGNFADLLIGRWGPLEIMASQHYGFANNQGALRAVMFADIAVRHPVSFCVAT